MNRELSLHILDELYAVNVRELCLCAGARNSPLVSIAPRDTRFTTYNLFEERSAAFFALGRIKATGRPVAVVTTSGTAAGELLPATMEAHYAVLPLVLVTADRPRRFRGTGAPQTAEQIGLFGVYVEQGFDLAETERLRLASWSRTRPIHVNVCFDEPLLPAPSGWTLRREQAVSLPPWPSKDDARRFADASQAQMTAFRAVSHAPIVIVGALSPQERPPAAAFLAALGAPVILESLSGLRGHPKLQPLMLRAGADALVRKTPSGGTISWMDGVLRLGSVPTLRLWRDLEGSLAHLPLLSLSAQPFSGATRGAFVHGPLALGLDALAAQTTSVPQDARFASLMARDRVLDTALLALFDAEPRSEPALIHRFSASLPPGSRVFLGNSLPIREWDLAAASCSFGLEMGANRGLNGIDGQMSTFYGFSAEGSENWALLGDLTTLYDMAAPWVLAQRPGLRAHLVTVNNGGGQIFRRMFPDPVFQNRHALGFEPLARFWDLDYECWEDIPPVLPPPTLNRGRSLVELVPDSDATVRFWQAYDALLADAGEAE